MANAIALNRASLCLDCELVTDLQWCPRCASSNLVFIVPWLNRKLNQTRIAYDNGEMVISTVLSEEQP